MTLTELRYIVTLAQEQHFGHAAERCHVSQPTLSVGVKKLEDELGVLIFERSKSAVRLTPVGEGIVAQAQKVLEQAQGIRELAQAGKNQLTAPLKVGAIYTVGPYLFPHLIPQLHRVAPQMPLYIEENFTHVLRDKLRNGELDAIIIALPFNEADVLTLQLYDEPFYVLMPAQHPWTQKETIDAGLLNDKSLLLLGEGHCFRDQVLEACPTLTKGNDGAKHTTVESSSLETIRHMVASGLGISILPLSAVDSHHYAPGVIEVRPLSPPVPFRTVAIAWRASFPRPKAIEILADSIRLCSVAKPRGTGDCGLSSAMTELSQVSVTALKGVGEAMAEKLAKVGLENLQDVLFHLPLRYQDRTRVVPIGHLRPGQDAVDRRHRQRRRRGHGPAPQPGRAHAGRHRRPEPALLPFQQRTERRPQARHADSLLRRSAARRVGAGDLPPGIPRHHRRRTAAGG